MSPLSIQPAVRHLSFFASKIFAAVLLVALAGCASFVAVERTNDAIPPSASALMREAQIPEEALGGVVMRPDGKLLWSRNATKAMQPASTIKVLTSIVALETLKPSYRGSAVLASNATQQGDILKGDLALVGRGSDEFAIPQMQAMLRALRAQGVARIEGDLILDREFFQPPRPYENVAPFDESPEFRYNVIPDALMLASNLNQLALSSNESELRIAFGPAMDRVEFVSEMTLVDKPCNVWEDDWKIPRVEKLTSGVIRVVLLGQFPKQCAATTEINILDRTDYAERAFRAAWSALGGVWNGRAKEGKAASDAKTISTQDSRSLAEINRDINKRSDNAMTRIALLSLAATRDASERAQHVSTFAQAERLVRAWLKSKNIDDASLVLENGSGLSRKETISPFALAQVLRAAQASKWSDEFMMSLPIVGIDGAMRNRLKDTNASEIGRMKTGGLRNVTSVAGYLPNAKGETQIVVLFLNHDNARGAKGRAVLDALMCEWLPTK